MPSELLSEHPVVIDAANKCTSARNYVDGTLRSLIGQIEGISRTGLDGATNVALQEGSVRLSNGMNKLLAALDTLAANLGHSAQQLDAADQEQSQSVRTASTFDEGRVTAALR